MFSFGMIKTASAVGGARWSRPVAGAPGGDAGHPGRLADPAAPRVRGEAAEDGRCWRSSTTRGRFAVLHGLLGRLGVDLDTMINTSTRSFAHGDALWAKIRRRPRPDCWPC